MPSRPAILAALGLVLAAGVADATEVTFRFRPDPGARRVTVAGTFNDWSMGTTPLHDPDGDGVWETAVRLDPGTYQYKFVVDDSRWITDGTAAAFADDGFGGRNSVLKVGPTPLVAGNAADAAATLPPGTEVTFRFRPKGPPPNCLAVAGTFNDWNAAANLLRRGEDGVWEITLRLPPGRHAYQFVADGDRWLDDPSAEHHEDDGFGGQAAVLVVD